VNGLAVCEVGMRKLREMLAGLAPDALLAEHGGWPVMGVHDDSREVRPNGLFVAVEGTAADGRAFIPDAVKRGATVVVGEDLEPIDGALAVSVPDARGALTVLALRWNDLEQDGCGGLKLAGVTGTNGKSTTAFMTRAILKAAGVRCALFGTLSYDLAGRSVPARTTTPGALALAAYLREAIDGGAQAAVLEVSSHALDQQRTDGLRFAAAAFTILTGDHLDYHQTFEKYRAAKARLFAGLDEEAVAVINRDDPHHEAMVSECRARVVTYAMDCDADIRCAVSDSTSQRTAYRMHLEGRVLQLENAVVGRHNVYNAMAAAGLARALGAELEAVEEGLAHVRNIPGRLQRVPCSLEADVFVDYAHTDDALRNVLSVLRPLTAGQLIVVFGCGGDRDRGKRSRMARVAAELADQIFVTSDNPRTEEPMAIIEEVLHGFDSDALRRLTVEPDRATAIAGALQASGKGDIVLVAGKGHENFQIIGRRRIHFDDVETAIQAAAEIRRFWPGDE
jgi:UDP-N-acetylmuramoyl-L-alanyl-D-glutamate--2,6-diaminopimelate ligase